MTFPAAGGTRPSSMLEKAPPGLTLAAGKE
jgi:hypothetical protein